MFIVAARSCSEFVHAGEKDIRNFNSLKPPVNGSHGGEERVAAAELVAASTCSLTVKNDWVESAFCETFSGT